MATDYDELEQTEGLLAFTVEIVTAHVAHNSVAMADVPQFIVNVHSALAGLAAPAEVDDGKATPIMDPKKSVKHDHLICLECGKKCQVLKAHLRGVHGLTPDEYREKYELPANYPMTPKRYTEAARDRAVKMGLGARMLEARNKNRKAQGKPPVRHAKPPLKAVGSK